LQLNVHYFLRGCPPGQVIGMMLHAAGDDHIPFRCKGESSG
jgi:hypothetical protein